MHWHTNVVHYSVNFEFIIFTTEEYISIIPIQCDFTCDDYYCRIFWISMLPNSLDGTVRKDNLPFKINDGVYECKCIILFKKEYQ